MSKGRTRGTIVNARPDTDKRARLWKAMRVLLRFDFSTIIVTTDSTPGNAKDFIARLRHAGFIRHVKKGGGTGRKALYQLVRNSGPLAPITRRNGDVYDQNTRITYAIGGEPKEEQRDDD